MLDVANGAWSETVTIIWRKQRKCRIVWDVTVINSAGHIKNELNWQIVLGRGRVQLLTDF